MGNVVVVKGSFVVGWGRRHLNMRPIVRYLFMGGIYMGVFILRPLAVG